MSNDESNSSNVDKQPAKAGKPTANQPAVKGSDKRMGKSPVPASGVKPQVKSVPVETQPTEGGKASLVISILSLILALGALAFAAWLWMQSQQQELQAQGLISQESNRVESLQGELNRTRDSLQTQQQGVGKVQQQIATINGRIAGLDSQMSNTAGVIDLVNQANANVALFETRLSQNESGINELREMTQGGRDAWRRAEIQYLLTVANQRVQVYRDPSTAIAAFQAADTRLQDLGDPKLVDVRQAVRNAVTELNSVAKIDIEGLALALASYADRVPSLALPRHDPGKPHFASEGGESVDAATEADAEAAKIMAGDTEKMPAWKRVTQSVYDELKTMVVVRHDGKPVKPMMPPEAEFFLRANLRIQIDAARAALLNRDTANFRASLKSSRDWLVGYFDQNDAGVKALAKELARLEGVSIKPNLPDVSAALRLMRGFKD